MAESNTQTAPGGNLTESLANELGRHAARMRYLAMAAGSIADGSTPTGEDRKNCGYFLMDTIEYLGEIAEGRAQAVIDAIEKQRWAAEGGGHE